MSGAEDRASSTMDNNLYKEDESVSLNYSRREAEEVRGARCSLEICIRSSDGK